MIPFVNLSKQYFSLKKDIDNAISRVLNRGWFILGKELTSFEEEFAHYCNMKYGVGVGSGTEALHLALLACGIRPGDEVITVPNTAVPTVSAIDFANARPAFVDIDPKTYTMDSDKLEEYLKRILRKNKLRSTEKPRVIIPVHLFGHPADMDPIVEVARKYDLKVVEDACQAHGTEYKGKKVGSIGDMGCFSFYPTKNLGAYGDSGMIVTDDEKTAEKLRMLRNYGEGRKYYTVIRGFNSRLDEIQAAILKVKLDHLDSWNKTRRNHASLYNNLLRNSSVITPVEEKYAKHVFHLYVIRTKEQKKLQECLKRKEIATSIHYPIPIHLHPAYRDLGYKRGDLPVSEKYATEILSLPMYPELEENQIQYICQTIQNFQA
jgi:dTDP-4-amino-4,6-dideoxygalactose transaminase